MTAVRSGTLFFFLAWLSQLLSNFGSGLTGIALAAWVLERARSVSDFSLFVLSLQLPGTLLLPLAGSFVDRWNRRTAMFVCFAGGAVSTITVLILLETGTLALWNIAVCSAVTFTFIAFHSPAYYAALCQMLPREKLVRASGLTQFSIGLALVAAPLAGGLLLKEVGVRGILILDISTFVAALLLTSMIIIPNVSRVDARPSLAQMLQNALKGWEYIRTKKGLMLVVVMLTVRNFCGGIAQSITPPMLLSLELGDFMAILLAFSIGGLGLIIGGAVLAIWGRMRRVARAILAAELIISLGIILLGSTTHSAIIAFALFLVYLALPFSVASTQVIIQYHTPLELQGRVASSIRMILRASVPLGTLASGPLIDHLFKPLMSDGGPLVAPLGGIFGVGQTASMRLVLVMIGVLCLVTVLSVWSVACVRKLDDLPPVVASE